MTKSIETVHEETIETSTSTPQPVDNVGRSADDDASQDPAQPPVGTAIRFKTLVVPDDEPMSPQAEERDDDVNIVVDLYENRDR